MNIEQIMKMASVFETSNQNALDMIPPGFLIREHLESLLYHRSRGRASESGQSNFFKPLMISCG